MIYSQECLKKSQFDFKTSERDISRLLSLLRNANQTVMDASLADKYRCEVFRDRIFLVLEKLYCFRTLSQRPGCIECEVQEGVIYGRVNDDISFSKLYDLPEILSGKI